MLARPAGAWLRLSVAQRHAMAVTPVASDRPTPHLGVDPRPNARSLVTASVRTRFPPLARTSAARSVRQFDARDMSKGYKGVVPSTSYDPTAESQPAEFVLMKASHSAFLASDAWAEMLQADLLPWLSANGDLGDDVLEIGPGPGRTTDLLHERAAHVTAMELDRSLANALAARLTGSNVDVVHGDGTDTGLQADRFSSVTCFHMLHHMPTPELQDRLFAEVCRVLRPCGAFPLPTRSTRTESVRGIRKKERPSSRSTRQGCKTGCATLVSPTPPSTSASTKSFCAPRRALSTDKERRLATPPNHGESHPTTCPRTPGVKRVIRPAIEVAQAVANAHPLPDSGLRSHTPACGNITRSASTPAASELDRRAVRNRATATGSQPGRDPHPASTQAAVPHEQERPLGRHQVGRSDD